MAKKWWDEIQIHVSVDGDPILQIIVSIPDEAGPASIATFADSHIDPIWLQTMVAAIPQFVARHYDGNGISFNPLTKQIDKLVVDAGNWLASVSRNDFEPDSDE